MKSFGFVNDRQLTHLQNRSSTHLAQPLLPLEITTYPLLAVVITLGPSCLTLDRFPMDLL
jgi:hypothetical protein